jgi:hypothetical protein
MKPRPANTAVQHPAAPREDPRRGERGVSLVLAMLVLFVIAVVVTGVRYSASVELDRSRALLYETRMRWLADAARMHAQSVLLTDVEQAPEGAEGDESSTATASADGLFDTGSSGDDTGATSDEEDSAASIADTTARTDSRLDEWMNHAALAPALGQDFQVLVEVVDEDGKVNLLGLWSPDEDQREPHREIVRRLLDKAFEGTSHDFSYSDATDILDRLDDWVDGQRGTFDPIPQPKLKPTIAQETEDDEEGLDTEIIDMDGKHYPLTLGELVMLDGIDPTHMRGFVEDNEFHPGLDDYLTIFSNLEVKPPPVADELFDDSPFTQGSMFDQSLEDTGSDVTEGSEDGEPTDELMAEPTNDGLVNVNTAPWAVLRAVAPEDVPNSFIDKIVEFRLRIDEVQEEAGLSTSSLLGAFNDDQEGGDESDEGAEEDSNFGDEEEQDATKYVFETPDEVIGKVEEEFEIELNLDPGIVSEFITRLAVTSQVFTVKILTVDPETGRRASWRTTVWRMMSADRPRIVTLLPLEAYHDPRRMQDFPGDLEELTEQRVLTASQLR